MKLISSILSLVIAGVLFFVVIDPYYQEITKIKEEVGLYNKTLNNSSSLQIARDALLSEYKEIKKEDKAKLEHLLPSSIDNIELILEIEKIANSYGIPIKDTRFDAKSLDTNSKNKVANVIAGGVPSNNLSYGLFPMEFSLESKYETFISFLHDIERNLRIIDVKSINFNSSSSASSTADKSINSEIYNYTLRVQTYWLK